MNELQLELKRLRKRVEEFERGASQRALFNRLLLTSEMHALIDAVLAMRRRTPAVEAALDALRASERVQSKSPPG